MAISSYSNPIPEIIDGLLRGHQLGLQMQQAARADQEFKTQQAMHNQQMSMQDIMNQHTIQNMGRSVDPATGMVTDTTQLPSMPITPGSAGGTSQSPDLYNLPTRPGPTMTNQAGISAPIAPGSQGAPPDVSNLPITPGPSIPGQSVTYQRKPDKSRLTAPYKTLSGNTIQSEAYTPEEVQQQAMAAQLAQYHAQEQAKLDEQIKGLPLLRAAQLRQEEIDEQNRLKLEGGGRPTPAEFADVGGEPGKMISSVKYQDLLSKWQTANKPIAGAPGTTFVGPPLPRAPGAGPAQPSAAAPGLPPAPSQPGQTTTTINVPGQAGAPPPPPTPGGMRVVGSVPGRPVVVGKDLVDPVTGKVLYQSAPDPEVHRHNLATEDIARINAGIRAGQLRQTQLVNGIEYGPETQDYWVKTLQENPDAVGEIPAKLKGAVNLKFRAATGLPMPTALPTTAKSQEIAARTSLDNLAAIQEILKDPEIQKQVGPIMGRLQNVEQRAGTAVNLSPQAENKAQELRTLMRYFTLSEGKAIMGGRIVSKVQEQLNASSPRVDMDASMLQGAIKGAGDYANTILDNTDKQRFGGKMRSREMRGAAPQQGGAQNVLPTGHKVGDVVTVKGKQYTIGTVHPDGSWDPAQQGQQSKTVSESELRKRATAQGQNADQAVQAAKQKGYTLVP